MRRREFIRLLRNRPDPPQGVGYLIIVVRAAPFGMR